MDANVTTCLVNLNTVQICQNESIPSLIIKVPLRFVSPLDVLGTF